MAPVEASATYGPHEIFYNWFVRWGATESWPRLRLQATLLPSFSSIAPLKGAPLRRQNKRAPDPGNRHQRGGRTTKIQAATDGLDRLVSACLAAATSPTAAQQGVYSRHCRKAL